MDAGELLPLVVALVDALLVNEGIDGDGGLAGLAVADDQLALAAADGHERVERLETSLHRLVHRFPWDDARRLHFHALALGVFDRALAVDRVAEAVDDTAEKALADRHRSEEHTTELQSLMRISYAVFYLKKKNKRLHDKQKKQIQ